jgi:hypothetical protein
VQTLFWLKKYRTEQALQDPFFHTEHPMFDELAGVVVQLPLEETEYP